MVCAKRNLNGLFGVVLITIFVVMGSGAHLVAQTSERQAPLRGDGEAIAQLQTTPSYLLLLGHERMRQMLSGVIERMTAINLALIRYRMDHDGDLPEWLSELYPDYLEDESILRLPEGMTSELVPGMEDPHRPVDFVYEFAPVRLGGEESPTQRERRMSQLDTYGDRVVMVRHLFGQRSLNLTYGGELIFTPTAWEMWVGDSRSLNDPDAQSRIALRRLAVALDDYRKAEGDWPSTLAALVPEYLQDESQLHCPVTGMPFHTLLGDSRNDPGLVRGMLNHHHEGYFPVASARNLPEEGMAIHLAAAGHIWVGGENPGSDLDWAPGQASPSPAERQVAMREAFPDLMQIISGRIEFNEMRMEDLMAWMNLVTGITIEVQDGKDIKVSGSFMDAMFLTVMRDVVLRNGLVYRYNPNQNQLVILRR